LLRRVRRRYLALKIVGEQFIGKEDLIGVLWDAVLQLFGEYGASRVNLSLVEYEAEGNYAILRCSHGALDMVRASIASLTEIRGRPVAINVIGVSGTLKSLRKKFF